VSSFIVATAVEKMICRLQQIFFVRNLLVEICLEAG
jgi:hypothetical protein